jgi:hypothetical protein
LLAKRYYEGKGQKLPYEVSLAILNGLDPVIDERGEIYFVNADGEEVEVSPPKPEVVKHKQPHTKPEAKAAKLVANDIDKEIDISGSEDNNIKLEQDKLKYIEELIKAGANPDDASKIAHKLMWAVDNYVREQKLANPDYEPDSDEIKQFVETKLKDGSLVRVEFASLAGGATVASPAASACIAYTPCLLALTAITLGVAGYEGYKIYQASNEADNDNTNYKKQHAQGEKQTKPYVEGFPTKTEGQDNENKLPVNLKQGGNNLQDDNQGPGDENNIKNKLIAEAVKQAIDQHLHSNKGLDQYSEWKIDQIIEETSNSKIDSFTSNYEVTESEAIELGLKWLGEGYKIVGKPNDGVFRSSNGLKQFRIDKNSLLGNHGPWKPHVHLENVLDDGCTIINPSLM